MRLRMSSWDVQVSFCGFVVCSKQILGGRTTSITWKNPFPVCWPVEVTWFPVGVSGAVTSVYQQGAEQGLHDLRRLGLLQTCQTSPGWHPVPVSDCLVCWSHSIIILNFNVIKRRKTSDLLSSLHWPAALMSSGSLPTLRYIFLWDEFDRK